jgi:hypothetical protein
MRQWGRGVDPAVLGSGRYLRVPKVPGFVDELGVQSG